MNYFKIKKEEEEVIYLLSCYIINILYYKKYIYNIQNKIYGMGNTILFILKFY